MQTPALFTMAQSSPQPQAVDTATYARLNSLPSPATSSSSSGELHLYIDSDGNSPSQNPCPASSSQELLLQGNQPPVQASSTAPPYPWQCLTRHSHTFLLGRTMWNSLLIPHQRQSSPTGRPQEGFVDHNRAHSRRFIHHQSSPRLLNTVNPYPHHGVGPLFPLSCHNNRLCNHRTIHLPPRTITRAQTPHQGDDLVPQSMRPTLPALLKYNLANHRHDMAKVPHEANSPHPPGESTPSRRHKASPTVSRGQISVFTNSPTPLESTPSKEFKSQRG